MKGRTTMMRLFRSILLAVVALFVAAPIQAAEPLIDRPSAPCTGVSLAQITSESNQLIEAYYYWLQSMQWHLAMLRELPGTQGDDEFSSQVARLEEWVARHEGTGLELVAIRERSLSMALSDAERTVDLAILFTNGVDVGQQCADKIQIWGYAHTLQIFLAWYGNVIDDRAILRASRRYNRRLHRNVRSALLKDPT
jgi:hypothetical protein